MAQIKKLSDGKYLIRVSKGTGGRRVYDNATFHGTLADARAEARDMEILINRGKLSSVRFEKCLAVWLRAITPTLSPRTVSGYDEYINRYAATALAGRKLGKIQREDIQGIYDAMTLSSTTVRNLHASLNAFFSWFVRRGDIKENPCKNTDRPASVRPDIVVMDADEAATFASHCREMRLGVIFEFALETGMRPEEYLALRWRDVSGNDVSVAQAVQFRRKGGGYDFKDIKTKSGRRRIPISERLRQRLLTHRREQNDQRIAMKGTWFNHDLVFPNEIGGPLPINNLTRRYLAPIFDKMWPVTEMPDGTKRPHPDAKHITLYSLRHTCATLLLMANTHIKIVSERLGHASVVITLDTYSHVLPGMQDDATDQMERILRGRRA